MAEYELALKSFNGDNIETWRSHLKNKKFELDKMQSACKTGISGGYAGAHEIVEEAQLEGLGATRCNYC